MVFIICLRILRVQYLKKIKLFFSEFLTEVDNGRVVRVEIQGKNIKGVLSNGNQFTTYAPEDPNLIQKLSDKGVSISASPLEEKMPSLLGILLSWFPMLSTNCSLDLFHETNARGKRWSNGLW